MALTKFNYNSFNVTPVASTTMAFNSGANGLTTLSPGAMTLIKTVTASNDATIDFVDGTSSVVLDNTYPVYLFKMINVHGVTDDTQFKFQGNASGGSGFNETITSSYFKAGQNEAGDYNQYQSIGGYGNTTSAVDAIQFKMNSGNIDAGTIKMYGVS